MSAVCLSQVSRHIMLYALWMLWPVSSEGWMRACAQDPDPDPDRKIHLGIPDLECGRLDQRHIMIPVSTTLILKRVRVFLLLDSLQIECEITTRLISLITSPRIT